LSWPRGRAAARGGARPAGFWSKNHKAGANDREREVLVLFSKGGGRFSLAWGGKAGEQKKERLWLAAEGEEAKGYDCERDGLVRGELLKNGKGDWAAAS